MGNQVLCKDCKYLIWYKWWWPYMGIETEVKQKCDHPKNHEWLHDAVTGEDIELGCTHSPQKINANRDCKWFEVGKHDNNFGGEFSPEDRKSLDEHIRKYGCK